MNDEKLLLELPAWPQHESVFDRYGVAQDSIFEEDECLLEFNGKRFLSRKDVHLLSGLPKTGKSTVGWMLVAALVRGENQGFKAVEDGCRVLVADTEQAPADVSRRARIFSEETNVGIHNEPADRVRVLRLRKADRDDESAMNVDLNDWRMTKLVEALEAEHFDFVVVDGVADICVDFMDASESTKTCQRLMELSELHNCAILVCLHLNPSDLRARGHLGKELERKCADYLVVCNQTNVYGRRYQLVEHAIHSRHESFGSMCFAFGEDGRAEAITIDGTTDERGRLQSLMQEAFSGRTTMAASELKEYLTGNGVPLRTIGRWMAKAVNLGILTKEKRGVYVLSTTSDFAEIIDDEDPL